MVGVLLAASTYASVSCGGAWFSRFADVITVLGLFFALLLYYLSARTMSESLGKRAIEDSVDISEKDLGEEFPDEGDVPETHRTGLIGPIRIKLHRGGVEMFLYRPDEIPLRVIADSVSFWRDEGGVGKWTVSDIEYGLRRTGKGNFPWFVKFSGDSRMMRVAYGGQGVTEADGGAARWADTAPGIETQTGEDPQQSGE